MEALRSFRTSLNRVLQARAHERAFGAITGRRRPHFPHEELVVEGHEGFLPGEREASAAHLARARLQDALGASHETMAFFLKSEARFERSTRPISGWLDVLFEGAPPRAVQSLVAAILASSAPAERRVARFDTQALLRVRRIYHGWIESSGVALAQHPDASDGLEPEQFLSDTDALLEELRDRLNVETASDWMVALQPRELDGANGPARRHRRVLEPFAALEPVRALERCGVVREVPARRAAAILLAPGERVQLDLPRSLSGVLADLDAALVVGRGLGLALIPKDAPVAFRHPVVGTVARAIGVCLAQCQASPIARRRSKREEEQKRLIVAAWMLLRARLNAAALCVPQRPPGQDVEDEAEASRSSLYGRALGLPTAYGLGLLFRPVQARARFRGWIGGLRLYGCLRELHGEDWYRNPRSGSILRDAARFGGGRSIEHVLADLPAGPTAAERLAEFVD